MKRPKIILIGAGSAMFTQGLLAEMIHSDRPWQLGLVDIDPQALQVAEGLGRKMVELGEADIQIEKALDRRDLLPGADAVVTTIGVGGRRAWEADVFIPRKHGIFQPVGDTAMAGGISRALRMIPAMVEVAQDVSSLCPQAIFLNYANPMSVICGAVRKATGVNISGLCIGVHEVVHQLADFAGLPRDEVTALAAGLNHFTWVYNLRWKGEDAWPLVRLKLEQERRELAGWSAPGRAPGRDIFIDEPGGRKPTTADNPFCWSLFETYGAYPSAGDRHVTEFFPERFPNGRYYGKQLGVDAYSFEGTIASGDKIYTEMAAVACGDAPLEKEALAGDLGEHSQLLEILESIEFDQRKTFSVNLPNRGSIPHLPEDAILEITAVATGRGFLPLAVPDFPSLLAAPISRKITAHQLTIEAALTGSRKLFVEALLADGCVTDAGVAARLADDLLEAHKAYLPQF